MKKIILLIISLFVLVGCELYVQDQYRELYAVEAYLVADQNLPTIWLTKTTSLEEEFYWDSVGVLNADLEVRLLNEDHSVAETYHYRRGTLGRYHPPRNTIVEAENWYQLLVTFPNSDTIEAKTLVPGTFETVDELKSSYGYQADSPIEILTTPSNYPGRQTYYFFTVNALDPSEANLTPFYHDMVKEKGINFKTLHKNTLGISNEDSYRKDSHGNIVLRAPWSLFAFFGQNDIVINTIDDNIYDFWRTQGGQMGGVSLSPGNINNIQYRINGGIGIFGSMARVTERVEILKSQPE